VRVFDQDGNYLGDDKPKPKRKAVKVSNNGTAPMHIGDRILRAGESFVIGAISIASAELLRELNIPTKSRKKRKRS
jgi:hypothetical protein